MKNFLIIIATFIGLMAGGCGRQADETDFSPGSVRCATLLSIEDKDTYSVVKVLNPWDSTSLLATYILAPEGVEVPEIADAVEISVPVKRALIFSGIYAALFHELGVPEIVAGVVDGPFITDSLISARISAGDIIDCGTFQAPDIEKIASLSPEVTLMSPYAGVEDNIKLVNRIGKPIVLCADYLESTPLGRAEWMRFFGRLAGRGKEADSIFQDVETRYNHIREMGIGAADHPKILVDSRYGSTWYVPTSGGTTDRLIRDAGGINPFADFGNGESTELTPEQVLHTAEDADLWLLRYYFPRDYSLQDFGEVAPEIRHFKAYSEGEVYGCNTHHVGYYDIAPFHPQLLLADMVRVFHPELTDSLTEYPVRFFTRL